VGGRVLARGWINARPWPAGGGGGARRGQGTQAELGRATVASKLAQGRHAAAAHGAPVAARRQTGGVKAGTEWGKARRA